MQRACISTVCFLATYTALFEVSPIPFLNLYYIALTASAIEVLRTPSRWDLRQNIAILPPIADSTIADMEILLMPPSNATKADGVAWPDGGACPCTVDLRRDAQHSSLLSCHACYGISESKSLYTTRWQCVS